MRQVQITLKNEQKEQIQKVLEIINTDLNIKNMVLLKGTSNSLIILRQKRTAVPGLIYKLNDIGVGIDFGIIDILPLEATIPKLEKDVTPDIEEEKTPKRITLEEIRNNIDEGTRPDLNYLIFIILSAIVAGAGLVLNSPAVVIASMILSPLMGPILGFSFGIMTRDDNMIKHSTIAQFLGIIISICSGIFLGVIIRFLVRDPQVTSEMAARNFPSYLDIMIAVCAGIAVGFCVTGAVKSTVVGAAIALSLMPPAVNVGLCLIYGELSLSLGSLILLVTNIIIINACTMIVLKIKKVHEIPKKDILWQGPTEFLKKKRKWFRRNKQ
ncbi:MAG: TIGR00341 family protein [Promethearchaeota archaeon]